MNWIPFILRGLLNSILTFAFIMTPISFNMRGGNIGIVYDQAYAEVNPDREGDKDCVDENGDNKEDYYRKGCAFKKSQIHMQDWGGTYTVAEVINYVFLLIMSMAFIVTIGNEIPEISKLDCPANRSSTITINMMRIAAAAHILQEIITSAMYKDAAQDAANDGIEGVKTDENKDAQLLAFDKLIEAYESMKTITVTKTVLHSVLEAAYLAAVGVETGFMVSCMGTCTANRVTASAATLAAEKELAAQAKVIKGLIEVAAGIVQSGKAAYAPLEAALQADDSTVLTNGINRNARETARQADVQARGLLTIAKVPYRLGELITPAMAATTSATAKAKEKENETSLNNSIKAEETQNKTLSGVLDGLIQTWDGMEQNVNAADTGSYAAYQIAADAECTKATIGYAACIAPANKASIDVQTAVKKYVANRKALSKAWQTPVLCCGAIPGTTQGGTRKGTIWLSGPPTKSQYPDIWDNTLEKNKPSASVNPPLKPQFPDGFEMEKMVKSLVYGGMMDFYLRNSMKMDGKNPQLSLTEINKYHKRAEAIMNASPQDLLQRPLNQDEIHLAMQNHMGLKPSEETREMASFISSITNNLFMSNAHAFNWADAGSKLGLSAGVMLIAYLVRGELQHYLLSSPKRRIILYSFMAVLGGVQLTYDGITLSEIKDQLKAAKEERERFRKAGISEANFDDSEGSRSGGSAVTSQATSLSAVDLQHMKNLNCNASKSSGTGSSPKEVRKGEAMSMACQIRAMMVSTNPIPTQREEALERGGFNLASARPLNPVLSSLINSAGPAHDGIQQGEFAGVTSSVSKAMREQNRKLLDKYKSEYEKDKKKGTKGLEDAINAAVAGIKSRNTAGAGSNLMAAVSTTPGVMPGESEDARSTSPLGSIGSMPSQFDYTATTATETDPFAMDSNSEALGEPQHGLREAEAKDLANFEIEHNDITKNPGVSIFKLLSNRYIIQYPKLLEKVAKLPEAKAEQPEPQAPVDEKTQKLMESMQKKQ